MVESWPMYFSFHGTIAESEICDWDFECLGGVLRGVLGRRGGSMWNCLVEG